MKKFALLLGLLIGGISVAPAQIIVKPNGHIGFGSNYASPFSDYSFGEPRSTPSFININQGGNNYNCLINGYQNHYTSDQYLFGIDFKTDAVANKYNIGIRSIATSATPLSTGRSIGVLGVAGNCMNGSNCGVIGSLEGTNQGAGIYGTVYGELGTSMGGRYAGYFQGDVLVEGTVNGVTITVPSDIRLKENVESLSSTEEGNSSLENIMKMNAIKYDLVNLHSLHKQGIDTASVASFVKHQGATKYDRKFYGLSAQELQKIYPDMVVVGQDGYLSVNYIELIPILIRSIQELKGQVDELQGESSYSKNAVASAIDNATSTTTELYQNNPNPFSESTTISFSINEEVKTAKLYVYDMSGKQIHTFDISERGKSSVKIDGGSLSAGMYIYALITDGKVIDTKRMILTK